MTNEEAITIIRKEYLCVDRDCDIERSCGKCDLVMPSKEPILQAYKLAIKALEQKSKYQADARRFKRKYLLLKQKYEALKAEQEPNTNYKAFAEWVANEIFTEDWDLNKDAFAEIACRKLNKLGIVASDGNVWKLKESEEQE